MGIFSRRELSLRNTAKTHKNNVSDELVLDKELWLSYLKKVGSRKIQERSSSLEKAQEIEHSLNNLGDVAFLYIRNINKKKKSLNLEVNF